MKRAWRGLTAAFLVVLTVWASGGFTQTASSEGESVIAPGAKLEKLPGAFNFTEGPVADERGNVYFSDYRNNRICMWSVEGVLSVFLADAWGPDGLDIDRDGRIISTATNTHAILAIDPKTKAVEVLADTYGGKPLNSPNDLWRDKKGGIYFTDPRFVSLPFPPEQDVMGVYYLSPDRKSLIRVIGDLKKPNGVTGSPDEKLLYVDDTAVEKTFVYTIAHDGTLSNRREFAPVGYDGLTTDDRGNVYITGKGVFVYSPSGNLLEHIAVPEQPTNVCFGGKDRKTLFITTLRTSVYTLKMRVRGSPR